MTYLHLVASFISSIHANIVVDILTMKWMSRTLEALMLLIITNNRKTSSFKQNFADSSTCAAFIPKEKNKDTKLTLIVTTAAHITLQDSKQSSTGNQQEKKRQQLFSQSPKSSWLVSRNDSVSKWLSRPYTDPNGSFKNFKKRTIHSCLLPSVRNFYIT